MSMPDKKSYRGWIVLAVIVVSAVIPLFFLDYEETALKYYWMLLAAAFGVIVAFRIAYALGCRPDQASEWNRPARV